MTVDIGHRSSAHVDFERRYKRWGRIVIVVVPMVAGILIGAIAYSGAALFFKALVMSTKYPKAFVALLFVSAGVGAHFFKRRNQFWYGFVEVMFGTGSAICLAWSVIPGQMTLVQFSSLIAASYVIARGLNNMHDTKLKATAVAPSPASKQ